MSDQRPRRRGDVMHDLNVTRHELRRLERRVMETADRSAAERCDRLIPRYRERVADLEAEVARMPEDTPRESRPWRGTPVPNGGWGTPPAAGAPAGEMPEIPDFLRRQA